MIHGLATLLLSVVALGGSLDAAEGAKPETIRIGFAAVGVGGRPTVGYSAIGTAQMKGLLEEEFKADGITIDWSFFKGAGPAVNEAVANGLLDFAWQGDFPGIIGRANGLKTRVILAQGRGANSYLAVPAGSPARTLADLKGKRVALYKGTNLQLVVDKALHLAGLSERDFQSINMESYSGVAAIAAGDLDGVWGSLELLELERTGVVRIIYSTRGQPAVLTKQTHLLVTEGFAADHPALVQRVVDVLVKEAAWESDEGHRAELFTLWTRMGFPLTTWEGEFQGTLLKDRESPLLDEFFHHQYAAGVQASLDFKLVRRGFDVDGWIDPTYVERAVAKLKLEHLWTRHDADGRPAAPAPEARDLTDAK